jgi:hypothetical protein
VDANFLSLFLARSRFQQMPMQFMNLLADTLWFVVALSMHAWSRWIPSNDEGNADDRSRSRGLGENDGTADLYRGQTLQLLDFFLIPAVCSCASFICQPWGIPWIRRGRAMPPSEGFARKVPQHTQ